MPKKNTKTTNDDNPVELEQESEKDAEAMARHHSEASIDESASNIDEEAEKGLAAEEGADATAEVPAEVAAMSTDNETAREMNEPEQAVKATPDSPKKKASTKKSTKAKTRSKKYQEAKTQLEAGKKYNLDEAIELIKKISATKFDSSFEVHLRLAKKKGKGASESPKGTFTLPHGTGKTKNIIVLDEAKIEEIAKTKKIDFDIALASPELMPKVGKIAKILGPKGKMPDPKSGTVTTDPKKAIEEINSGRAEYRIDPYNNIHQIIGKTSWDVAKLKENALAVLSTFPKTRLEAVYFTSSMSPSITVDLNSL